jgi:hypothetical protein
MMHRGDDHRQAVELLRQALPSGKKEANALARLLDMKDEAHYGVYQMSSSRARSVLKWAKQLVSVAEIELQR